MGKLHEIIAVSKQVKGQWAKVANDLITTFDKKGHNFVERLKTTTFFEEDKEPVEEFESSITTSVDEELTWLGGHFSKVVDVINDMASGNQRAMSDIVLDGEVIFANVPVVTLVELEGKLQEFKTVLERVPTLEPAKGFELDPDRGKGVYAARLVRKPKTKKIPRNMVLEKGEGNRPGQFHIYNEDVEIGKIEEREWSSFITPARKTEILNRAERLISAVKQARSRANEEDVNQDGASLGKVLSSILTS